MKNLITCLVVCVMSGVVTADKAQRGSAYPLEDGQIIANNYSNLQRYGSPCSVAPWNGVNCSNWIHETPMATSIGYVAVDSQGLPLLFNAYSTNRSVYRFNGIDIEFLFQLPHEPQSQPTVLGDFIYYTYHTNERSLYKANIITGEVVLVTGNINYGDLASDGVNLFTMQHVIKGNCCWECPVVRYSQIWTVNSETGDLESLVCNWMNSCGTVGDARLFTCCKGYFHVIHHDRLMLVDPSPVNSIVYAGEYCDEDDLSSLSSMQTSGSYSPDLDCSGDVGVDDLLILIGKGGGSFGPADLNKDGHVNVHDLLILIGDWA